MRISDWSSDVCSSDLAPETGIVESYEARREELIECAMYFKGLWEQRINEEPKNDLISIMAHSPATRDMPFLEFLGNLLLLIVGGNDTTRSDEHTSELQSLMRLSYAVFCLKKNKTTTTTQTYHINHII